MHHARGQRLSLFAPGLLLAQLTHHQPLPLLPAALQTPYALLPLQPATADNS
jgi:hypothetical protein